MGRRREATRMSSVNYAKEKDIIGYQDTRKNLIVTSINGIILVSILSFASYLFIKNVIENEIIKDPGKPELVYIACSIIIGYVIAYGLVKIFKFLNKRNKSIREIIKHRRKGRD